MFIRSDMIRLNIGKDTDIEYKSLRPMHHQPLGRHFHHNGIAARIRHLPKITLQYIGLRRRIIRGNMLLPDDRFYRADQSHLPARMLQNGFDKISRCRLSLRPGNPDDLHTLCRMAKIGRR